MLPDGDKPIRDIAAGSQFGLACDVEGDLYCWGKGERGQLGISNMSTDTKYIPSAFSNKMVSNPTNNYSPQILKDEMQLERNLNRKRKMDVIMADGSVMARHGIKHKVGTFVHYGD
jgi:alpha-tubulin suppressor-like RCC1 family protein